MLKHFTAPFQSLSFQFSERYYLIHKPHFKSLFCRVLPTEIPNFPRFLLAHNSRQITASQSSIERSHLRSRLAKFGVVRCKGQVANHMKHMTTSDCVSSYHCNDWLWKRSNFFLKIEHI